MLPPVLSRSRVFHAVAALEASLLSISEGNPELKHLRENGSLSMSSVASMQE
jgi:hypothetical protein